MTKHDAKQTPAVAYIRMSSDRQEASPDQQRAEVAKLAKRDGYKLIREYFDEGISGDATEKRKAFRQMIRDAEEKADFAAILCWDQDRFGRFDSIEAGRWIYPLRHAGVWMHTVRQGRIDWNNFQSRMMFSIQQEGKFQFLLDLAHNSLRGRIKKAASNTGNSKPGYGYDRVYFDESNKLVKRVPYGERFTKPATWRAVFAPSEDPEITAAVRWTFETFATDDRGVTWLAQQLTKRNPPKSPPGGWCGRRVEYMLRNPLYIGVRAFGRRSTGKYCHINGKGEIGQGKRKALKLDTTSPIVIADAHEPLVDAEIFERVQAKLNGRNGGMSRPRQSDYILSGVLRCGHCGATMCGEASGNAQGTKYYRCRAKADQQPHCPSARIRQVDIEAYVLDYLCKRVATPEAVDQIRRALHRQETAKAGFQASTKVLQAKIDTLDKKIIRGTENLLLADPEDLPAMSRLLADWRGEREQLFSKLDEAVTRPTGRSTEETVNVALRELARLRNLLESAEPTRKRAAVKALVSEITVWFEPNGKRKRLARGVLVPTAPRGVMQSMPKGAQRRFRRTPATRRA